VGARAGAPTPRSAGEKELSKVPARGEAGVEEGSVEKVRAGAGGGNGSERTSCARRRMRAGGGGRPGKESDVRGGPVRGGAASAPLGLLWGCCLPLWCFGPVSPGPHAFAGVTSYPGVSRLWFLGLGKR
jgi:hypothetical protein